MLVSASRRNELPCRVATELVNELSTAALGQEHSLGPGHPAGRRLWQIVRRASDDEPVAVRVPGAQRVP